MSEALPEFLCSNESHFRPSQAGKKKYMPFFDRTIERFGNYTHIAYNQAEMATRKKFLQQLAPGTKLIFMLTFILLLSFLHNLVDLGIILIFIILLYFASGISLSQIIKIAFWPIFLFGFIIAAPAVLNIVSGGSPIITIVHLEKEYTFWIYHVPSSIGISWAGLHVAAKLILRITGSILLTLLVIHTTPLSEIIKSIQILGMPPIILMALTLSVKFIFILSKTTEETYLALKSRWLNYQGSKESSKIIAGRIDYVFRKSWMNYEEIYNAMIARGYSGRIYLYYRKQVQLADLFFIISFLTVGIVCTCL